MKVLWAQPQVLLQIVKLKGAIIGFVVLLGFGSFENSSMMLVTGDLFSPDACWVVMPRGNGETLTVNSKLSQYSMVDVDVLLTMKDDQSLSFAIKY